MALIDRNAALALINVQNSSEIFQVAAQESAVLSTFRTIPMSAKQTRMPVLSALPTAGFLASDNTAKPTTSVSWANKILEAEEVAVIVPIPENVFDDSAFGIWENVRPLIGEAVGAAVDAACLFGTGKPTSWPAAIVPDAAARGNTISASTNAGDLAEDFNQTIALVEADGFDPDTIYSNRSLRASLRGLRDSQNRPIYNPSFRDNTVDSLYGLDLKWVRNGSWVPSGGTAGAPTGAIAIVGDRNAGIIGLRQDMTFKMLTEATVGGFNLAEQDMIALRVKMRVAFQVADPVTRESGGVYGAGNNTSPYPFAALRF